MAFSRNLFFIRVEISKVSSIAFVAMGTDIYKWPANLAASIAFEELTKSRFDETIVCFTDEGLMRAYVACSIDGMWYSDVIW